jgi:hypothetical protein
MLQNGHLKFLGGAQLMNMRPEVLVADPVVGSLFEARVWWNSTEKVMKYFDGATVEIIARGGNLNDYIRADGTVPMLADLLLSSATQAGSDAKAAVSKGHVETELAKKQDVVTGGASTIVAANLTASKALASDSNGKVVVATATVAELNQLVGVTAPVQTQIDSKQAALGYVPVNKAGDNMDGDLALQGHLLKGLGAPVAATDAARKIDIENALAGLNWQDDVDGVQKDATLVPVATIGKRYVITDITKLAHEFGTIAGIGNGDIVQHDGTEFVVVFDVSADAKADGTITFAYDSEQFVRYVDGTWSEFGGMASLVAGVGLVKEGNVINVNLGAGIAQLPTDEVGVDCAVNGALHLVDGEGNESTDTAAKLAIKLDGPSLVAAATGLKIAAAGVTAAELSSAALGLGLQGGNGVTLSVKAGTGIVVDADGVKADLATLDTRYVNADGDSIVSLLITGAITDAKHAVSKEYADVIRTDLQTAVAALAARVSDSVVVYDGTATAQTTHTFVHGLGNKYGTVTVVDENDYVVGADEIRFVDDNTVAVDFVGAQKCKIIFSGKKAAAV